jgi:hypothetical protein
MNEKKSHPNNLYNGVCTGIINIQMGIQHDRKSDDKTNDNDVYIHTYVS